MVCAPILTTWFLHVCRSLAVDLEMHRVYVPDQEENGKPAARMVVYDAVTTP